MRCPDPHNRHLYTACGLCGEPGEAAREIERLREENVRMKRVLQAITSSQFLGQTWPKVYDRILALAYEGLRIEKERPATSV